MRRLSGLRRPLTAVLVCAAILTALTIGGAQQQGPPRFRLAVDYVSLDVVVSDGSDRPVTDLTRSDFEVIERGRVQTIADFTRLDVPTSPRPPEALRAAPLGFDVATNMPAAPESRLFAVVVDDLHLTEAEIVPVKRVLSDFFARLSPADEAALVFVGRSNLGVNFTSDVTRLMTATDRLRDAFGFGLDAMPKPSSRRGATWEPPDEAVAYARRSIATLQNVVGAMATSRHPRRAILYLSGGSMLDPGAPIALKEHSDAQQVLFELQQVYDEATRAGVPVYALDPRGPTTPEQAVRGWPDLMRSPEARYEIARRIDLQQDYLVSIGSSTGGRAFINHSNLTRAVETIVAENSSVYLIGYYPDPPVRDGAFHEVDVRVKRAGVRVRARRGYVAPSDGTATPAAPPIEAAIASAINVSGLRLRGVAAPLAVSGDTMTTLVTVEVSYPLSRFGGRRLDDTLPIQAVGLDPDARVRGSSERTFVVNAAPGAGDDARFLVNTIVLLPGRPDTTLRVAVASRALGTAGSIQMPLPQLRASERRLQMTPIVVGHAGEARQPVLGASLTAPLVPFQPTTDRTFTSADTLRVFARLFWRSRDATAEATLTLQDGASSRTIRQVSVSGVSSGGDRREGAVDAELPLAGVEPGRYLMTLEAAVASGSGARQEVVIEVK